MKLEKIVEAALGVGLIATAAVGDEPGAIVGAVMIANAFGVKI
jgi:predicted homoserine dehydrogenase-like protein